MTDANLDVAPGDALLDDADSELWDVLLESLAEGCVVPIVGLDLLTFGGDEKPPLYTELAARLAAAFKMSPDVAASNAANPLGAVAADHILRGQDSSKIYRSLAAILQRMEPLPIPAPLQQLAGIEKFNLFVTTTFDSQLERAVHVARGERPRVYSYSTKSQPMADEDLSADGRPTDHLPDVRQGLAPRQLCRDRRRCARVRVPVPVVRRAAKGAASPVERAHAVDHRL